VALQGDLTSFALPDVLRLLAGAGKSGHLEVTSTVVAGEVLLHEGTIAAASTNVSPAADDLADVVFELLRIAEGSFSFDEGQVDDAGFAADVERTLEEAAALVEEWAEIEAVVPSMGAWVSLAAELDLDEVTVTAAQWRAIVATGSGGNVHDLAAALDLSDLAASRQVVELVEAGLVEVRATHGYQPPQVELDDFEAFEDFDGAPVDPMADLQDLSTEDRPVVIEESDDALLPEPLPGEGVAYDGESITGVVDGRGQQVDQVEQFEQFESLASFEAAAAMSERIGEPGTIEGFGGADPFAPADPYGFGAGTSADEPQPEPQAATEPIAPADLAEVSETEDDTVEEAAPVDEERDSLLKFLSSVKP
jgi:hypothetical protein